MSHLPIAFSMKSTVSLVTKLNNNNNNKLTTQGRVLLVKLTGPHLIKKFPTLYGTPGFITAFTTVQVNPVHAPHPTSLRSTLILSSHLYLGLPSGLFPQVSPSKSCMNFASLPYVPLSLIEDLKEMQTTKTWN